MPDYEKTNKPKFDFKALQKTSKKGLLSEEPDSSSSADSSPPPKGRVGRKKDPEGVVVSLSLSEMPRSGPIPPVMIIGSGRRTGVTPITLPIPKEIHERFKNTNVSASLVALMVYALERLDEEGKTLLATYTKEVK